MKHVSSIKALSTNLQWNTKHQSPIYLFRTETLIAIYCHLLHITLSINQDNQWGNGRGAVGRVVASNSRGPMFQSSHQQHCIFNSYRQMYWKEENKEKEGGNERIFLKKTVGFIASILAWAPSVCSEKIAKCLLKLPKNDFTWKMIDFDTFTKIA